MKIEGCAKGHILGVRENLRVKIRGSENIRGAKIKGIKVEKI